MGDADLHIMVVAEWAHAVTLDWSRVRQEAAKRGAVVSLVQAEGTAARWVVPAGAADAAPGVTTVVSAADAVSGAGAAVIDRLFEAQAMVPRIQRTEIRLFGGAPLESALHGVLDGEPSIGLTVVRASRPRQAPVRPAATPVAKPVTKPGAKPVAKPAQRPPRTQQTSQAVRNTPYTPVKPSPTLSPVAPAVSAPTPRRSPVLSWIASGAIATIAILIAVALMSNVAADQTAEDALVDGAALGPTLGAEVARAADVSTGGTGLERRLAVDAATGAAFVGAWDGVRIFDTDDLEDPVFIPVDLENGTPSLTLSPDATRIFLTGGSGGESAGELVVLSGGGTAFQEEYRTALPGAGNMGEDATISPDGGRLYIADANTGFWIVSTADGSAIAHPIESMTVGVAVNQIDGAIAVGSPQEDATVLMDAQGTRRASFNGGDGLPDALAFSPDGSLLAIAAGESVSLYRVDGEIESLGSLRVQTGIADVSFSPSSAEIAVLASDAGGDLGFGSDDEVGGVRIFDIAAMIELTRIPLTDNYILGDIAFSGEQGQLLVANESLTLVDVAASRTNGVRHGLALAALGAVVLGCIVFAVRAARRT